MEKVREWAGCRWAVESKSIQEHWRITLNTEIETHREGARVNDVAGWVDPDDFTPESPRVVRVDVTVHDNIADLVGDPGVDEAEAAGAVATDDTWVGGVKLLEDVAGGGERFSGGLTHFHEGDASLLEVLEWDLVVCAVVEVGAHRADEEAGELEAQGRGQAGVVWELGL
jgi:hypothetical protein